jgi:hypothetical protein
VLLIVRLKIELDIKHDEEEHSLERKVQRIRQINTIASVPVFIGICGFSAANGERAGHRAFSELEWTNERLGRCEFQK